MTGRIRDAAVQRATVAMLRSLGATEVVVRTALPTGNDQRGLGLRQFDVAEARLSNALVKQTSGRPLKLEIVVSASEVEAKLGTGEEDASEMLRNLAGICWGDYLLHVAKVDVELFAGSAYLYRIFAEA